MAIALERLKAALAGRYRLDRQLGEGGMATVYLAHDLRHSRAVAIKVLKAELAVTLGPERFLREIAVTARLDHPHILPLLDSGEADGVLYYVMPFVEGESLRDRLNREHQLPVQDAVAIIREVADALNYAHNLGVIHRDVKPENILLAGGHARIGDFGIALVAAATNVSATSVTEWVTAAGMVIGTTLYMSPEQATGGRDLDRRTDIYSLAAVAYEMLAGQPPHTGVTADALLARKLREPVSSLRIVREAVPPAMDEAIRKALARVPADRFSTALQFADALDREPVISRTGYVLATVLAVALGGVLFWFLSRDADSRWLAREALPAIERHLDVADFESAYALANEITRRLPGSVELIELWPRLSWRVTIASEPPGARVFRQAYDTAGGEWEDLGRTPLMDIRFPFGLSRLRFELEGYRPLVRAMGGGHLNWDELRRTFPDSLLVGPETFKLETEQTIPSDMIRVPGWTLATGEGTLAAHDFLLGRYEVTNAEYKKFVDASGYARRELWEPVIVKGRSLSPEDAMRLFVDRTGRPGPSTWEAGDYRDGEADFPV
jgi:serine/threonine protein kinase